MATPAITKYWARVIRGLSATQSRNSREACERTTYPPGAPDPGPAIPLRPMSITANLVAATHAGRNAAREGADFRSCPYRSGGTDNLMRTAWLRGWTEVDAGASWSPDDGDAE